VEAVIATAKDFEVQVQLGPRGQANSQSETLRRPAR
jgi:hypothetical protein